MEIEDTDENQLENEEGDELVEEIDVYLSKSLEKSIYILQYPIKPIDKNYDSSKYLGGRIKPKQNKLELEIDLNTTNDNYSKAKGEQFALNVDGKQTLISLGKQQQQQQQQPKYFRSSLMDKQVFTSTNATLGQMNRFYQIGILKNKTLHLTPVQSILQMKPSFEYFDIYEKKVKDSKDSATADTDYSTEEETEGDVDKAELVTMKFSSNQSQTPQEPEQNWIPLSFLNLNERNSKALRELLFCKKMQDKIKIEYSQEELINRLVDNISTTTATSMPIPAPIEPSISGLVQPKVEKV